MRAWLLLFLLCGPASAATRLSDQWRAADKSGLGALTRAEAAHVPRLAAHFDAIDRDADGRISADEVRAWRKAQSRRTPRPSAVGRFLEQADADGDGLLSLDETLARLPRLGAKFARLDRDGSGALSREEIDEWFALRRASRRR